VKDLVLSHFTTWHFVQSIRPLIQRAELLEAYKVSKEQTVFVFDGPKGHFHLITYFSGYNAFFWVQEDYGKPRSKYTTVFKPLNNSEVQDVVLFKEERSFALTFGDRHLIFALFGRLNHIRVCDNSAIEGNNWTISLPGSVEKVFEVTKELGAGPDFITRVLGKSLDDNGLQRAQRDITDGVFSLARNPSGKLVFGYGYTEAFWTGQDVLEALFKYSKTWFREFHFSHTYQRIKKHLEKEKKRLEKGLKAAEQQLDRLQNELNYRMWADLLMANLHQLESGVKLATLKDFYGDSDVQIPLKSKLNIQENAASYYRKAKNQSKEQEVLEQRIERFFEQLENNDAQLEELEMITEIKPLLGMEKRLFESTGSQKNTRTSDFVEFELDGFKVYVGRNSKNNDALTLGFASKNDLWLHAKDLAGSHVLIRNKGSETRFPKHVIEQAAEIAAHFSKGRNQEFCPVLYTLKKYVRKPKGAPAGAVLVDREEVLLVRPGLPG